MPHERHQRRMTRRKSLVLLLTALLLPGAPRAARAFEDAPATTVQVRYRVTGLFSPDRQDDLRELVATLPEIKLVSVDFKYAEATFEFDTAKAFPNVKPEQVVDRLNDLVRNASRATFTIRPLSTTPREKLLPVEIAVIGLDCKGCSFAAYESISVIDGVEQATASFKDGRVTALIDPARTDRAALEEALKKKGVQLKEQP